MRYTVFHENRRRPEVFRHGQFAEAFTLAEQLGGDAYVMDWWRWDRLYPPAAIERAERTTLRVAAGT